MTSFHLALDPPLGDHVQVRVFAGPDDDHRAYLGSLRMREVEAADLLASLNPSANFTITVGQAAPEHAGGP